MTHAQHGTSSTRALLTTALAATVALAACAGVPKDNGAPATLGPEPSVTFTLSPTSASTSTTIKSRPTIAVTAGSTTTVTSPPGGGGANRPSPPVTGNGPWIGEIEFRTQGTVVLAVSISGGSCALDLGGTLTVQGTATDGTSFLATLAHPATGSWPIGSPALRGPTLASLTVTTHTNTLSGPMSGTINLEDPRGLKAAFHAERFTQASDVAMDGVWKCR